MKEIDRFHAAVNDTPATALHMHRAGRKTIGYLCSYAPEELIYAAGFHPMRLFSSRHEIMLAENHLQSYCCSLVRGILEDSLEGRLDFLEGTVFPHTCDSMQRLSDIWRMNGKYRFFADLVLPAKLNTKSAAAYMEKVLARFKEDLEAVSGKKITDTDLSEAIALCNRVRRHLFFIYEWHSQHPGTLRGSDLYALVKGAMIMDKKEAAGLLAGVASRLEQSAPPAATARRLILSGSVCDTPDIFDAVEKAGGAVVGDDLCTGRRWFDSLVPEDAPPLSALAQRCMNRLVCPAKHAGLDSRAKALVSLVREHRADGVVFLVLKFCDPHAFDYPYLKNTLDKQGIKTMIFEMDDQQSSQGQFSTRMETFIHML